MQAEGLKNIVGVICGGGSVVWWVGGGWMDL